MEERLSHKEIVASSILALGTSGAVSDNGSTSVLHTEGKVSITLQSTYPLVAQLEEAAPLEGAQ